MDQNLFNAMTRLEMAGAKHNILQFESAKFISMLVMSKKAQGIVEIGSGAGYATLWLAYAASITGGKVISCEMDEAKAELTRAALADAGMSDHVEVLVGDARENLRHREGAVDFVLIDADHDQYETYFDVVYKRMGSGSMIVAEDVVASDNELSDYVTYVQNHPNLESVTIELGDGLEISVKTID